MKRIKDHEWAQSPSTSRYVEALKSDLQTAYALLVTAAGKSTDPDVRACHMRVLCISSLLTSMELGLETEDGEENDDETDGDAQ